MKSKKGIWFTFFPLVLTIGVYVIFYRDGSCTPADAIFWMIFAMGMSFGVTLTHFFIMTDNKKENE